MKMDKQAQEAGVALLAILGAMVAVPALYCLLSFFRAYIILDIAQLFGITFLIDLGFAKITALNVVIGLYAIKSSSKNNKFWNPLLTLIFTSLAIWGMAYVIHWIIYS